VGILIIPGNTGGKRKIPEMGCTNVIVAMTGEDQF
jgi:hypothetical protein